MKSYFLIVALALTSLNAHAALHKWVDADGKVHYSDTVPSEATTSQTVQNVSGKGPENAPATYSPKSVAEREMAIKKSRQAKDDAAQKKAEQDSKAEAKNSNCEGARHNARIIEEGVRVVTYDANGERTFLDDDARARKLEEARQAISNNCN
jgi:hypothetical protein